MAWTPTRQDRNGGLEVVPSDRELKSTIVSRLRENPYTEDARIKVAVHDGVVRLDGRVPTPAAKAIAVEDVETVPGVADIDSELVVAA